MEKLIDYTYFSLKNTNTSPKKVSRRREASEAMMAITREWLVSHNPLESKQENKYQEKQARLSITPG